MALVRAQMFAIFNPCGFLLNPHIEFSSVLSFPQDEDTQVNGLLVVNALPIQCASASPLSVIYCNFIEPLTSVPIPASMGAWCAYMPPNEWGQGSPYYFEPLTTVLNPASEGAWCAFMPPNVTCIIISNR